MVPTPQHHVYPRSLLTTQYSYMNREQPGARGRGSGAGTILPPPIRPQARCLAPPFVVSLGRGLLSIPLSTAVVPSNQFWGNWKRPPPRPP